MTGNPYVAPQAPPADEVVAAVKNARRKVTVALAWLAASVGALVLGTFATAFLGRAAGGLVLALGTLVPLVATILCVRGSIVAARAGAGAGLVLGGVLGTLFSLAMMLFGALGAMLSTASFQRGRQLRRLGRVMLPPVGTGDDWANDGARIEVDAASREALAEQWRANGRTEHASVAAFARLTLDLMTLGAPPALLAAAQRDALDEIAHAEACFALARAIDGREKSPQAFPAATRGRSAWPRVRVLALAALAVDSLIDGALNEGLSARVVARLSRRCREPTIRAVLRTIAADEGRHSAHGWDVVQWCLREGGAPVASALRGAVVALSPTMGSPLPVEAEAGAWERWGIHGRALEEEEYGKAYRHVIERVEGLLAA